MQILDLGLEDPASKGENLGSIQLFLQVTPVTGSDSNDDKKTTKQSKSIQVWKGVVSVLLLEASDLPAMDNNGEDLSFTLTGMHGHCNINVHCKLMPPTIPLAMTHTHIHRPG